VWHHNTNAIAKHQDFLQIFHLFEYSLMSASSSMHEENGFTAVAAACDDEDEEACI
jgi:hypothetical protein